MNAASARGTPSPNYLGLLVSPLSADDFLRDVWARQFMHVSGHKDKFKKLFSWGQLNKALEHCPLEPPRIRLSKDGKDVEPQKYLVSTNLGGRGKIHHIRPTRVIKELRQGATLILSYIEALSPELKHLSVALEKLFRVYVNVNLYAAFGGDGGFGLHWDDQDSLILQLEGRKRWAVYEPTRNHPVIDDKLPPPPTAAPVWDGILDEGGLFHIPRGWWHLASPVNEPSLHLTITVNSMTGLDFLRWFVDGLKNSESVRANIPVWATPTEERDHFELIKQELLRAWKPDVPSRFVAHLDTLAVPYCNMGLPNMIAPNGPRIDADTNLILSSTRPLVYRESENGTVTFTYDGRTWKFRKDLLPVLDLLDDGRSHTLGEISALASGLEARAEIEDFLSRLVQGGLVITEFIA